MGNHIQIELNENAKRKLSEKYIYHLYMNLICKRSQLISIKLSYLWYIFIIEQFAEQSAHIAETTRAGTVNFVQ